MIELAIELARIDERLKALGREIERSEVAGEKALGVAASELHRRLELLNGEASRLREMQQTYVLREVFDRYKEMIDDRADARGTATDARLKVLESANANLTGRQAAWSVVVLILAAAISAIVPIVLGAK